MEIALYYAPNTCALAPYITLTEAGADFEVRPLNYRKQENFSAEYLKINPKHKVPALVVDGKVLTENVAMHQWVHRTFPDAKLLPADPWDELQAISLHAWFASGIHPYLSRINNPLRVCDAASTSDNVIKFATEYLLSFHSDPANRQFRRSTLQPPYSCRPWMVCTYHTLVLDLQSFNQTHEEK